MKIYRNSYFDVIILLLSQYYNIAAFRCVIISTPQIDLLYSYIYCQRLEYNGASISRCIITHSHYNIICIPDRFNANISHQLCLFK